LSLDRQAYVLDHMAL